MASPFTADQPFKENNVINESEQSVDPADDAGKLVQLGSDGRLNSVFLKRSVNLQVAENIDGSTLPQAVSYLGSLNQVIQADADVADRSRFYGFLKENANSVTLPSYLSSTNATDPSFSYELPAGSDRLVIVVINYSGSAPTMPSGVTWDGNAMTKLGTTQANVGGQDQYHDVWYYAAGDSGSAQNGAIVLTGYNAPDTNLDTFLALGYQDVNQTTPIGDFDKSDSDAAVNLTLSAFQSFIVTTAGDVASISLDAEFSLRETATNFTRYLVAGDTSEIGIKDVSYDHNTDVSTAFILNPVESSDTYEIQTRDMLAGFSGLTPGKPVYLSNTAGAITQNTDEGQCIGVAYSATEILIDKPRQRAVGSGTYSSATEISIGFRPNAIRLYDETANEYVFWVGGETSQTPSNFTITNVVESGFTISATSSATISWEAEE